MEITVTLHFSMKCACNTISLYWLSSRKLVRHIESEPVLKGETTKTEILYLQINRKTVKIFVDLLLTFSETKCEEKPLKPEAKIGLKSKHKSSFSLLSVFLLQVRRQKLTYYWSELKKIRHEKVQNFLEFLESFHEFNCSLNEIEVLR